MLRRSKAREVRGWTVDKIGHNKITRNRTNREDIATLGLEGEGGII